MPSYIENDKDHGSNPANNRIRNVRLTWALTQLELARRASISRVERLVPLHTQHHLTPRQIGANKGSGET
jgi:hypothetical protein